MKKKLDVINLELGIEPDKLITPPGVTEKTQQKLSEIIEFKQEEQQVQQHKIAAAELKEEVADKALHLLLEEGMDGVPVEELNKLANGNLSGLILRVNNLIKKRGDLWKLKKKTMRGKAYYILKTSV